MEKHSEKQKDTKSDSSPQTFDALALLIEHKTTVKGADYAAKPADLDLNPAEISKINPKEPTAVFLDKFKNAPPASINSLEKGQPTKSDLPVGHGDVSAMAAEQNGFNVVRVDDKAGLASELAGIEKDVSNGKLPLGKGDVINISMGQEQEFGSMSYPWASQLFGTNINKNNVGNPGVQKVIREKMEALAKKPGSDADQTAARDALSIQDSVNRLQKKGIQIMHAQPDKPNTFDAEFMNGKMELTANGTDGKVASFATDNKLSKPMPGVFQVQFPSYDIFNQAKVSDHSIRTPRDGSFSIKAGDKIYNYGPATNGESFDGSGAVKIAPNGDVSKLRPDFAALTTNPSNKAQPLADSASAAGSGGSYKFEAASVLPPLKIVHTKPASTERLTDTTFGSIVGTSFVNIVALAAEKDKLKAEKLLAH